MADMNFVRIALIVIDSIRNSLDFVGTSVVKREALTESLLLVERARISVNHLRDSIAGKVGDPFRTSLVAFERDLNRIENSEHFLAVSTDVSFRLTQTAPKPIIDGFSQFLGPRSVFHALKLLRDLARIQIEHGASDGLPNLRDFLPPQKIAPIQFEFKNNILSVARHKSLLHFSNEKNVELARAELIVVGKKILDELVISNCDKRLVSCVDYVQNKIQEMSNIIGLGYANIACGAMYRSFASELPGAVAAMLEAYTKGIELLVLQFPDWRKFIANAVEAKLDVQEIQIVHDAINELVNDLQSRQDIVDPEVPKTLAYINSLIADPKRASKSVAYALLRSVENFISSVFSYGSDFLQKSAERASELGSKVVAHVAVFALAALIVSKLTVIIPVTDKINGMEWMRNALELVQKQLQKIKFD